MNPYAALAMMMGSEMLGGLLGGDEGDGMQSFADPGMSQQIHPAMILEQFKNMITRLGQGMSERAGAGVSLPSSYVQQPGAYTGGGLPMPIGLTASDPALRNPGLLSLPGVQLYDPMQSLGVIGPRDNTAFSFDSVPEGESSQILPESMSASGDALTDDLEQALGAASLLMRSHLGAV